MRVPNHFTQCLGADQTSARFPHQPAPLPKRNATTTTRAGPMPPRMLTPLAAYLHSWIVSKRCLGVVATFQRALGVREQATKRVTRNSIAKGGGQEFTCIAPIHVYFKVASILGSEIFYIVFLPLVIWQVDYQLGRSAILFWNVLFFIGNAMKDLLCLPRPLNPPVLCLEKEYSAEYGLPSVHALGTFVPLYCLLKHHATEESWSHNPYWRVWLLFTLSVCFSRLYLGVHSVPDLVAGWALGSVLLAFGIQWGDMAEDFAMNHPLGEVVVVLATIGMVWIYPVPDKPTPTLSYTVSVMGAGGGVLLASRWLLSTTTSSSSCSSSSLLLQTITHPPPLGWVVVGRIVIGLSFLIVVKTVAKPVAKALIEGINSIMGGGRSSSISSSSSSSNRRAKKEKDNGGEMDVAVCRALTASELLIKYLTYFSVGSAVILIVPSLWLALGL